MSVPTNSQQPWSEASVYEIITFGYKGVIKSLIPITKAIAPAVVLFSIANALYMWLNFQLHGSEDIGKLGLLLLSYGGVILSSLVMGYFVYAQSRFIRDMYWNDVRHPLHYLKPGWSLWGAALMGIIFYSIAGTVGVGLYIFVIIGAILSAIAWPLLFITIPLGIVILLGFLALFNWYTTISWLAFLVYLGDPGRTFSESTSQTFKAYGRTLRLHAGNFWRTMGLANIVIILNMILMSPTVALQGGMYYLTAANPSMAASPQMLAGWLILFLLQTWFQLTIGSGGLVFVLYRYYYDLEIRSGSEGRMVFMDQYRKQAEARTGHP